MCINNRDINIRLFKIYKLQVKVDLLLLFWARKNEKQQIRLTCWNFSKV